AGLYRSATGGCSGGAATPMMAGEAGCAMALGGGAASGGCWNRFMDRYACDEGWWLVGCANRACVDAVVFRLVPGADAGRVRLGVFRAGHPVSAVAGKYPGRHLLDRGRRIPAQ